jgi:carbonic anhydrase
VPETQAIQRYLKPLTALARAMATEDGPPSLDLLVEENVAQQVRNLLHSQIVADDWARRGDNGVTIHGWVYQLENVSAPTHERKPGGYSC